MRAWVLTAAAMIVLVSSPVLARQAVSPHGGGPGTPHASPAPNAAAQLIEQMRGGGLVLVIRHERTQVPSRDDDYSRPASDCTAQRNLSMAGLAGAQETGFALRALAIPVDAVISSPMCRTTETARFMFGDYSVDPRLIHPNPGVPGGRDIDSAAEAFAAVLRDLRIGTGNTALISHAGNIARGTGLRLAEGEIGVVRVTPDGAVEALGQIVGSTLGGHARLALAADAQ